MYREWFPQIMYNHHQTGPAGTVMFAPPFRDPFNYNFDPLVPIEHRPGRRGDASSGSSPRTSRASRCARARAYSTWWNGGLRTTAYFHNMIGLLTETIGNPTPIEIPFVRVEAAAECRSALPDRAAGWHFRQSIEYSMTANRAVLDVASRDTRELPLQHLPDGEELDRAGQPRHVDDDATRGARRAEAARRGRSGAGGRGRPRQCLGGATRNSSGAAHAISSSTRAARPGHARSARLHPSVRSAGLPDRDEVRQRAASRPASRSTGRPRRSRVGGKNYPAGSFVVKTAQAFRPHVLDMFEPQDHPDDIPYPGGPPTPPYDNAGWTLAFQMGVQFDRILDGFDGPFERDHGPAEAAAPGRSPSGDRPAICSAHASNDAFIGGQPAAGGGRGRVVRDCTAPRPAARSSSPAGRRRAPRSGQAGRAISESASRASPPAPTRSDA